MLSNALFARAWLLSKEPAATARSMRRIPDSSHQLPLWVFPLRSSGAVRFRQSADIQREPRPLAKISSLSETHPSRNTRWAKGRWNVKLQNDVLGRRHILAVSSRRNVGRVLQDRCKGASEGAVLRSAFEDVHVSDLASLVDVHAQANHLPRNRPRGQTVHSWSGHGQRGAVGIPV